MPMSKNGLTYLFLPCILNPPPPRFSKLVWPPVGVSFSSTPDAEIIPAMIATHPGDRVEDAIADVLPRLRGAFSIVAMTKDRVVAFRDPHGLRPLALGALEPVQRRRIIDGGGPAVA